MIPVAHGSCRWIVPGEILVINRTRYNVVKNSGGSYDLSPVHGSRVKVAYTVTPGYPWDCSCPDSRFRRRGLCKHASALKAALAALGGKPLRMPVKILKDCTVHSVGGEATTRLRPGTVGEYKGHVPLGMLLLEIDGVEWVVNPRDGR